MVEGPSRIGGGRDLILDARDNLRADPSREIQFERALDAPAFGIPPNGVNLYSPQWRAMQGVLDEIMGRPAWRKKFHEIFLYPTQDAMVAGFNFFYDQFRAANLGIEAGLLSAFFNGFFGRNRNGMPILDFRTFEGNPSKFAKMLDDAGIIELKERLYTHGEVMNLTVLDEAESVISAFKAQDPEGERLLMETLYKKGEQLGRIMGAKYPALRTATGTRVMVANAGQHLGQMMARSEGIDQEGNIFIGGKVYDLKTKQGIEAMVDAAFEGRYATPSGRVRGARAERSIRSREPVGATIGDDEGRTL